MNGGYPPPGMGMPPMGMPPMGMSPPMGMPPMPMGMPRPGLGMRPPGPAYGVGAGQGPSMMALASQRQQQQAANAAVSRPGEGITLFVGSIAGGITDAWMERLLSCCGMLLSFKRLITPANKPQGFGFATFDSAEAAARAVKLLDGVELPGMEDGAINKKLHVRADEANKARMEATLSARMSTDSDEAVMAKAKADVSELVSNIRKERGGDGSEGNKDSYVVPPHLHDLQEADLPETQRGLVISEIALFRERSAKREREKEMPLSAGSTAPGGPKRREWGKAQEALSPVQQQQGFGRGAQGYNKPVGFVKEERMEEGRKPMSDFEMEEERKEARRKDEEMSFRDRQRRYEPREKQRINALERQLARQRAIREAEERDAVEMKSRLHVWDDDESDESFYTDRERWRSQRARRLAKEEAEDIKSRKYEEEEAEHLRRESEAFLARQMEDMQALADEQRKAGMLLDDGAPVRLNMSLQAAAAAEPSAKAAAAAMFAAQEEEEESLKKRKAPLVKLDFSAADGEKAKEQLEKIRQSVAKEEKDVLFKSKVRWDCITDQMVDRKFEPLIKRQMVKYLGELEDDDLVMFSVEHLKDHKGPQKLVEGLEPVLEEDAVDLVIAIWKQVIFESMAYSEGLNTERIMVE